VTGAVRVTHPFHPRFGQELAVAFRRCNWGEDRVFYRDCQGLSLARTPSEPGSSGAAAERDALSGPRAFAVGG